MSEIFEVSYAAHTASCTFLLDAEGICRRIVMSPTARRRDSARNASRCVGAQYVASLDGSAAGGLVEMPRIGASMLFARVDERGRVALVRTGVVTRFETMRAEDPFAESGAVRTSAPQIPPSPRLARASRSRRDEPSVDPDYHDMNDRTRRIPALRPEEIVAAELATSEYPSAPADVPPPRPSRGLAARLASASAAAAVVPLAPTLRAPRSDVATDDDDDPYVRQRRQRSDAYPSPASSDVKMSSRRRRGS